MIFIFYSLSQYALQYDRDGNIYLYLFILWGNDTCRDSHLHPLKPINHFYIVHSLTHRIYHACQIIFHGLIIGLLQTAIKAIISLPIIPFTILISIMNYLSTLLRLTTRIIIIILTLLSLCHRPLPKFSLRRLAIMWHLSSLSRWAVG
jgi:hypothetical protein